MFERPVVAVFEQVVDERLHATVECLPIHACHHLVERRLADERLHVVVARGLTDEPLGILCGLE